MVTEQKYETLRLREAVTEGISLGVIPSTTFPLHQTFSTVKECHTYTVLAAKSSSFRCTETRALGVLHVLPKCAMPLVH